MIKTDQSYLLNTHATRESDAGVASLSQRFSLWQVIKTTYRRSNVPALLQESSPPNSVRQKSEQWEESVM